MQEKYTEDIDKLDSFYQENLREASVEPPAALWDKISTSYSEQTKPKSIFFKNRILILLLLLLLISASGSFLYFRNSSSVNKGVGGKGNSNSEQGIENRKESGQEIENREREKKGTVIEDSVQEEKKQVDGNNQKKNETKIDSFSNVSPASIETSNPMVEEMKLKLDTVSAIKEIPKKKISFREKHTQNIKADSLRPLFVPVK